MAFNFDGNYQAGLDPALIAYYNAQNQAYTADPRGYSAQFGANPFELAYNGNGALGFDLGNGYKLATYQDKSRTKAGHYEGDSWVDAPLDTYYQIRNTKTNTGADFDSSGKYLGDFNANKDDMADLGVMALVGGAFGGIAAGAAAAGGAGGAAAAGGGGAAAGGAGGAVTGLGDAGLMYGGADAAAAGSLGGGASIAGGSSLGGLAGGGSALGGLGGVGGSGATASTGGLSSLFSGLGSGSGGASSGFNWSSLVGPALSGISGIYGANAASDAAKTQAQAAADAAAMFKPWIDNGTYGINQAGNMLGRNGAAAATAAFQQDPGYQFRLDQGNQALTRAAAANGTLGSGKYLKDAMAYNQGQASQEFGNSYNRLLALAGMGQTATGSSADYTTQGANASAAGTIGQANALTNALGQGYSMYSNNQLMNRLFPNYA